VRIAAVVVTYNRLNLLKECIDAIRNQTRKVDEIIVINNSSTDGTLAWLEEQNDLTVITQENLGGAGGFYTGIKTAYEKGYDWIWCMDDDVEPETNALKALLSFGDICSCLVPVRLEPLGGEFKWEGYLDLANGQSLPSSRMFPTYTGRLRTINTIHFEGTLLNREVVKAVGFPDDRFFLSMDDVEYGARASIRFTICQVRDASVKRKLSNYKTKVLLGRESTRLSGLQLYYQTRNYFLLLDHLRSMGTLSPGWKFKFAFLFSKRLLGSLLYDRDLVYVKYLFLGLLHGVRRKFGPLRGLGACK